MLGVNGYAFAITSNGNVLFHQKLSSAQYLEEMESLLIDISNFEIKDSNSTLRNKMIDRKTETLRMKSVLTYENKMRAAVTDYNYYITAIEDTPFSLAIALPRSTGLFKLNGSKLLQEADALNFLTSDDILAPWSYCEVDENETNLNPVEVLLGHLMRARSDNVFYEKFCDKELISGLLFDAEVTRNAIVNWRKADYDGDNETHSHRNGVELVFIGTKSGLTRYLYSNASIADREFVHTYRSTIEATYYTRAVLGGSGIFTFSIPFKDAKQQESPVLVTASTPISISLEGVEAVGAVVGTHFKYSTFYEVFMNSTRSCDYHESWCSERTCASPDVGCYLLDENGYVVLSKDESEVGLFFGELEGKGAIMNELIIEEEDEEETEDSGVFRRMLVTDRHSLCDIFTGTRSSSSSSFLIEPCRNILFYVKNIIHELFLFFVQLNLFNWLYSSSAQGNLDYNNTDPRNSDDAFNYATYYEGIDSEDKSLIPMMMECAYMIDNIPTPGKQKREKVKNCFDNIKQQTLPRFTGRRSCTKARHYYMADTNQLPHDGTATSCKGTEYECPNKFSVNRVPRTNLVLLVIDSRCSCPLEPTVSSRPFEVIHNNSYECQMLQREVYRKRPIACHAHSHEEDYSDCGLGHDLRPGFSLLLASSAFSRVLHMLT